MHIGRRFLKCIAPACAAGLLFTANAQGETLNYATGYPPNSIGTDAADKYVEALERYSDGDLTAKVYPLSLLNFLETSGGLRDGIADAGYMLFPYFTSEFPRVNLLGELSMLLELTETPPAKAGMAFAGAMSEFVFLNCPECLKEFEKQNHVYIAAGGSPPYSLLCNQPVNGVDNIKGKRLRVGGPQWSRWAEAMGATPVSMSVNEIYEGLDQGVVDCTIQSRPELTIFRLMEVTTDLTTSVPGGVYGATGNNMNRDTWQGLSPDNRKAVLHASAVMSAHITWLYAEADRNNLTTAREKEDLQVHEASQALKDKTRQFIKKDMAVIAESYREDYGVDNAEAMIEKFRPILERWAGLVRDVDSSEELAQLYWEESFSRVDVTRYGE